MISDEGAWGKDDRFRPTGTRCNFPVGKDAAMAVPCRLSPAHGGEHLASGAGPRTAQWEPTEESISAISSRIAREGDIQVRKDYEMLVDQVKLMRDELSAKVSRLEAMADKLEIAVKLLSETNEAISQRLRKLEGGPG